MKRTIPLILIALLTITIVLVSCDKEEDPNNTDETENTESGTKPEATLIRFAANAKDCGITDGFANQQHSLPELIHLNLDKCNGDTNRPTLTLNFEKSQTIGAGTYSVTSSNTPGAGEVYIYAVKYNFTDWVASAGSVVVTQNADDDTKIDIELKSITMQNQNAEDTLNPATDTLTGYIIKI